MLNRFFIFLFTLVSFVCWHLSVVTIAAEDEATPEVLKELEVIIGLEKIIKLDFVPNTVVKLANENIASYQIVPSKKELTLVGTKAGETTLTLRDAAGDIRARYLVKVTANDQSKVLVQLKELLGDIEGLEIGVKGDSIYVGGQIVVPGEIGRMVMILDKYPEVLRLVELSPQTQIIVAKRMQEEIQKNGLKDVTVRVVNGSFWLEGVVGVDDERTKALKIVNNYLPDKIQTLARRTDAVQTARKNDVEDFIIVSKKKADPEPVPKLFRITAQFVELTKAYDRLFAFTWTPAIGAGGGEISLGKSESGGMTTASKGTLAATISNLFPKLNSAKSAGHARVVDSGVIVVKDKIAGVIKKTTTIPFQVGAADNAKAGSAVSGFDLNVTPEWLQQEDKINLKATITVSSSSGNTPPQTFSNTVDTQVIVKSQESAVIGGVVTNKSGTDFDKDGDQSQITNGSALFSFVKSKKYTTSRSQFVIFITPEVIESASTGASEIERKFRKRSR